MNPISDRHAGKVAIVTGAASGIGAAVARRFVAEGGMVAGGDVNEALLGTMADQLGDAFIPVVADVTKEADIVRLIGSAVDKYGRIDIGYNVAGGTRTAPLVDMSEEDWRFTIDLCLTGVFLALKHEARQMIAQGDGGAIVNIASLNSRVPMFFNAGYTSAKAGVAMLTQNAALELAEHKIRVSTVSPGLTATPLTAAITTVPEVEQAFLDRIPLKRSATPEDIAASALFLTSDDASYITGVNLFVDGGWEQTAYPDLRPLIAKIMAAAAQG